MESFAEVATLWLDDVRRTRRAKTVQSYEIALQKFTECVPEARTRFVARADLMKFRDWRGHHIGVVRQPGSEGAQGVPQLGVGQRASSPDRATQATAARASAQEGRDADPR